MAKENLVETTKSYYDSEDADEFYFQIWGGEDIHIGLYENEKENIAAASRRTVERLGDCLAETTSDSKILDMGSGYGGAARYLAKRFKAHITCLNLSETENKRNKQKNLENSLDRQIDVVNGNFEEMPFKDESFDVVWSQDAILHSGRKEQVFSEISRVLKKGGELIFTDPMQSNNCPDGVLDDILKRIHLEEMGSVVKYKDYLSELGMKKIAIHELPHQLQNHYIRVREELLNHYEDLKRNCSQEYLEGMKKGLQHWIDGAKSGYLNWGILHYRKPFE